MKPGDRPEERNKIDFRCRQHQSTVHIRYILDKKVTGHNILQPNYKYRGYILDNVLE